MRSTIIVFVALVVVCTYTLGAAGVPAPRTAPAGFTRNIPERPARAKTGSAFADAVAGFDAASREEAIRREILSGNIPSFLRHLAAVDLHERGAAATIFVMPDYLAIGSDDDFLRIPMNLVTATAIADAFGFVLPTRKIVDAVYAQSAHRFAPHPLPAGPRMTSTDYYRAHNAIIDAQAAAGAVAAGTLVAGHKKDVVWTNLLARMPGRIAIYGWHRPTGVPIQPLSTVHGACYADYSHGIRLVADAAWHDGAWQSVREMLRDAQFAGALSDEGVIRVGATSAPAACGIGVRSGD